MIPSRKFHGSDLQRLIPQFDLTGLN
jgi:hypothetical protein